MEGLSLLDFLEIQRKAVFPKKRETKGEKMEEKRKIGRFGKEQILGGVIATCLIAYILLELVGGVIFTLLLKPVVSIIYYDVLGPILGDAALEAGKTYLPFVFTWAGLAVICLLVKPWRQYLKKLWTGERGNTGRMLLIGVLVGFVMNFSCILLAFLTGSIHLSFSCFEPVRLVILFLLVFIQSSYEEALYRCFTYQRIAKCYDARVAVVASAVFFSIGHMGNDSVTYLGLFGIALTGILYALILYYFDSIWLPMAAHTAWNFTQNVLFGLPNSGFVSKYSVISLSGKAANGFAYDTGFGVESSWCAVIVEIITCLLVIYFGRRRIGSKETGEKVSF